MVSNMGFSDVQYAAKFRDLVTRIVRRVIAEERPAERVGRILSWNSHDRTAMVIFPGDDETNATKVRYSQAMVPAMGVNAFPGMPGVGDVVRVAGKPGSYYIAGYVSGGPGSVSPGTIAIWPTQYPPEGWLECDGSAVDIEQNKALFLSVGTTYGGDSTSFNLPTMDATALGSTSAIVIIKT